jgi:hypothetical protein
MSILRNMRDIAANMALVEALDGIRKEQLAAAATGAKLESADLVSREQLAVRGVVTKFYGNEVSAQLGLESGQTERRDQYQRRSTAIADEVALETHRILCALPIVGLDGRIAVEELKS